MRRKDLQNPITVEMIRKDVNGELGFPPDFLKYCEKWYKLMPPEWMSPKAAHAFIYACREGILVFNEKDNRFHHPNERNGWKKQIAWFGQEMNKYLGVNYQAEEDKLSNPPHFRVNWGPIDDYFNNGKRLDNYCRRKYEKLRDRRKKKTGRSIVPYNMYANPCSNAFEKIGKLYNQDIWPPRYSLIKPEPKPEPKPKHIFKFED